MTAAVTIRKNGQAEMAYTGETPWHSLGQKLRDGALIDEWITAAGMDWKACRSRVRYGEPPNQRTFDSQHVLFRSDTKAPLAVVGDGFKIVQPREVLEFFRELTVNSGLKMSTAGTLFGGRRFWALAELGDEAFIIPKDKVAGNLLLVTALDGTLKTTGKVVATRVVCWNTLSLALGEQGTATVKVSHRTSFDSAAMKTDLGLIHGTFVKFITEMRELAKQHMTHSDADKTTLQLLVSDPDVLKDKEAKEKIAKSKPYQSIMRLFDGDAIGANIPGVSNTAWGWLNAVTEHVDHHARALNVDNRLNSAWFGHGDELKTKARELVTVR
jgi:phage/plasmid-like protein (TIGR03299 family)